MNDEIALRIESGQKRLQEQLVGFWADDVWLVTPKTSTRKAVYLRFSVASTSLKVEIKYAVWSRFDSQQRRVGRDHKDLRGDLTTIITWLNHFSSPIQSLMDKSLEQWEISLRSHIIQTGRLRQQVRKFLLSTQEYRESVAEDPRILLFRQLYGIVQDAYDDRPVLEKDIWDLRKLGLDVNLADTHFTLNFTLISQLWLRDLAKAFMRQYVPLRSPKSSLKMLSAFRCFSQFLAQKYPTACISDIDRSMLVEYISFLNTYSNSNDWRLSVLSCLKVTLETCAHQLKIAGLTKKQVIFPSDFPKKKKHLSREIPQEILTQLQKYLETLDTTTLRMVVILLECGMRISELCTLPLECLICDDKHDWYLRSHQRKSKKEHVIPLVNTKVVAIIQAQQQCIREQKGSDCPYLFPNSLSNNLPFKAITFATKLNVWALEKDIRDSMGNLYHFQAHQFRHTVGMRLINDDIPLDVISRLFGHSSLTTTYNFYAYKHGAALRRELERVAHKYKVINHQGEIVSEDSRANTPTLQITRKGTRGQTLPIGGCGRPVVSGNCEHANKCLNCTFWLTSTDDLPRMKEFYKRAISVRQKAIELDNQIVVKNQDRIIPNLALRITKLEDTNMDGSLSVNDLLAQLQTDLLEVKSELGDAREQGRFLVARQLEHIVEDLKEKITALEGSL